MITQNDLTEIDVTNHPILFRSYGHEDTSKKYRAIPTASMVNLIKDMGWIPHEVIENNVRKPNREGFQTHRVFFHHPDFPAVNGAIPRIMLSNAYDARLSYKIALGLLVEACANGLFVSTNWSEERVVHTGEAIENAIKATQKLTEHAPKIVHSIERFSNVTVSHEMKSSFNREAIQLRHARKEIEIEPTSRYLDNPNRFSDQDSNLWSLFNRVQENLIRGKYRYFPKMESGVYHNSKKARAITGIDASDRINKGLWELTERFATPNEPKQLELIQ